MYATFGFGFCGRSWGCGFPFYRSTGSPATPSAPSLCGIQPSPSPRGPWPCAPRTGVSTSYTPTTATRTSPRYSTTPRRTASPRTTTTPLRRRHPHRPRHPRYQSRPPLRKPLPLLLRIPRRPHLPRLLQLPPLHPPLRPLAGTRPCVYKNRLSSNEE